MAVSEQQGDKNSLLEHYRRFLAFRRAHPALCKGEIEFLAAEGDAIAFVRREGNEQIACAFNLGSKPATIGLGDVHAPTSVAGHGFSGEVDAWFGRLA